MGGVRSPGKVLEKNLTGELGPIVLGLKFFIFLCFGSGIWPLRFSQNCHCYGPATPTSVLERGFTFAYLFLSGTILEGIEFCVPLKNSGPSSPIDPI